MADDDTERGSPERDCPQCRGPMTPSEIERGWNICDRCRAKARRSSKN